MRIITKVILKKTPGLTTILWAVLLLIFPESLPAQIEIQLPSEIYVKVNEKDFIPTETWNDSLIDEANNAYIRYEIVTTYRNLSAVTTRIRIPQFYTLPEMIRQIILYYYLLSSEEERKNETVFIYPFFKDIQDQPLLICTYKPKSSINITMSEWHTVPVPPQPSPEYKYLYNQLIEADFKELRSRDKIPDEIFEKVARENEIGVEQLYKVYQSVKLWQLSQ